MWRGSSPRSASRSRNAVASPTPRSTGFWRPGPTSGSATSASAPGRRGGPGPPPRPAARPRPPIWIGGSSKPALRRVAARGDGWIPQGTPKKLMPEAIAFIERARDRVRPGATFDIGVITEMIHVGDAGWELPQYTRSGAPEKIVDALN